MSNASTAQLVEAFQESVQKRSMARRIITILLLGVILLFLFLVLTSFKGFFSDQLPEVTQELQEEFQPVASKYAKRASDMVNTIAPAYVDAFADMFDRELPNFEREFNNQLRELEVHMQSRWPAFEQQLDQIVSDQEDVVADEMKQRLGYEVDQADIERISRTYADALSERLHVMFDTTLDEHLLVANQIGNNVYDLAEAEYKTQGPIDSQEAIGILLELVGLELQADYESAISGQNS